MCYGTFKCGSNVKGYVTISRDICFDWKLCPLLTNKHNTNLYALIVVSHIGGLQIPPEFDENGLTNELRMRVKRMNSMDENAGGM